MRTALSTVALCTLALATTALVGCSNTESAGGEGSDSQETNSDLARPAAEGEVRLLVQADANSPKQCVVYETEFKKLKVSSCANGDDGAWRAGWREVWRNLGTAERPSLVHLEGKYLHAVRAVTNPVTMEHEPGSFDLTQGKYLTISGGPVQICLTLNVTDGDTTLGVKQTSSGHYAPLVHDGCALFTIEPAKQVFGKASKGALGEMCDQNPTCGENMECRASDEGDEASLPVCKKVALYREVCLEPGGGESTPCASGLKCKDMKYGAICLKPEEKGYYDH